MNTKTPKPERNMAKAKSQAQAVINPKAKNSGNSKTSLAQVLVEHNRFNADGTTASAATQDKYADILYAGFRTLREELGYKLDDVQGFRGKHMEALAQHWERQYSEGKLSPATVQNQMSIFRRFSAWIGKDGMVEGSHNYVSQECCGRTSINTVDKSWSAQGANVEAKIAEVTQMDSRVGLQLELSMAFGLRAREAMQLCPHIADKGAYLEVTKGTTGGADQDAGTAGIAGTRQDLHREKNRQHERSKLAVDASQKPNVLCT